MSYFLFLAFFIVIVSGGVNAGEFRGFQCKSDCSGHKSGFAWAEKKGIRLAERCTGGSQSFREGCLAFVAEKAEQAETDAGDIHRPLEEKPVINVLMRD